MIYTHLLQTAMLFRTSNLGRTIRLHPYAIDKRAPHRLDRARMSYNKYADFK